MYQIIHTINFCQEILFEFYYTEKVTIFYLIDKIIYFIYQFFQIKRLINYRITTINIQFILAIDVCRKNNNRGIAKFRVCLNLLAYFASISPGYAVIKNYQIWIK